jgi:thiol-disulfide isomerase/thioredoxin
MRTKKRRGDKKMEVFVQTLAGALVLSVVLLGAVIPRVDASGSKEKKSKQVSVTDVNLEQLKGILEQAGGKVTVVNLWATWCPPCVAEMPELAEFHKRYNPKGVQFVSLAVDRQSRVLPFAQERQLPFPVYTVSNIPLEELANTVIEGWSGLLPTTVVLDKKGEIRQAWAGQITLSLLAEAVDPLLSGERAPQGSLTKS